ncbi:antibiotic biosynthesis monooxygenase family protein [Kiloniella sp. b19]|uniref:antibiotic biosynthesis monooxygenase family protein n=1 Tax=Kiloniella sp. GXU_MW_B19 TaxID=3141326 RepID=UPI0031CDEE4D
MIAVIFEVRPKPGRKGDYLALAAGLKPLLQEIDGFISVERFQSLVDEEKLLSLSFFRDESALEQWRNLTRHRAAQSAGRDSVFDDYRIRVASVVRDYGMTERAQAPQDSQTVHRQGRLEK